MHSHTHTQTHTQLIHTRASGVGLSYWWGRTFSSWPGNYSCCHGETGDSPPHLLPWQRRGSTYRACLLCGLIIFCLALHTMNVSQRRDRALIYMLMRVQRTRYSQRLNTRFICKSVCKKVNKDILIWHPFTAQCANQREKKNHSVSL